MKILSIRIKIWHLFLMNILLILKAHLWPTRVLLRLWENWRWQVDYFRRHVSSFV